MKLSKKLAKKDANISSLKKEKRNIIHLKKIKIIIKKKYDDPGARMFISSLVFTCD